MAIITSAAALGAAFEWAIGRVGDTLGGELTSRFKDARGRRELIAATEQAVAAAAVIAPEIADDLCSPAYLHHVLAPGVINQLHSPGDGQLAAEAAAKAFLKRFVIPYVRDRNLDDVLTQVLRVEPARLESAFEALVGELRRGLIASRYWREPVMAQIAVDTLLGVTEIRETLAILRPSVRDVGDSRREAHESSSPLRDWESTVQGLYLDRPELETLVARISGSPHGVTLVTGVAGSGKSALLARLTAKLETNGMTVFAIKADLVPPSVTSMSELSEHLGLSQGLTFTIEVLARVEPVVVIIDQLDAVSEVMDRSSGRMQVLLQVANRWRQRSNELPPVHVIVSSRPFEAEHDARFQTLRAQVVELGLPTFDQVANLLRELSIDPQNIPENLRDALRRPFRLKLYVDLVRRGAPLAGLADGLLLEAWLRSLNLDPDRHRRLVELLETLAEEMTETETLWRPADGFALDFGDILPLAEARELVVRREDKIAFAHQTWLDDFQARRFKTGTSLVEAAWSRQDSLFGRATLLRGLERLRAYEPSEYGRALGLLLERPETRRHLRYLAVDFLSAQDQPTTTEVYWLKMLLHRDPKLARRGLGTVASRWSAWRADLADAIPLMAATTDLRWRAAELTIAEAKFDPSRAEAWVFSHWSEETEDAAALDIFWRAGLWTPRIQERIKAMNSRGAVPEYAIGQYIADLCEADRTDAAVELLEMYLANLQLGSRENPRLHGLGKLAHTAPTAFTQVVFKWFAEVLGAGEQHQFGPMESYPSSGILPYNWRDDVEDEGPIFANLRTALALTAKQDPDAFHALVRKYELVELDEVQSLLAEGYAQGGACLAGEAASWLLADPRRLRIGRVNGEDEEGVGMTLHDWSTRVLLRSLRVNLPTDMLYPIVAAIEGWDPYREDARAEAEPARRRDWRRWSEEYRLELLNELPTELLASRRKRQVQEHVKDSPRRAIRPGRMMARSVPSPMSSEQMTRASDKQLLGMINRVRDSRKTRAWRGFSGGASELAQAFAAFGIAHPDRAIAFAQKHFEPGLHENFGGSLIRELSQAEVVPPNQLLGLIWKMDARGFASEDWHHNAAWALQRLSGQMHGLEDADIQRLKQWLIRDPHIVANRAARRAELDRSNRDRNAPKEARPAQAMLFGRGLDGLSILPHDNFPFLHAIGDGYLNREPPAHDAWLEFLEGHAGQAEDPQIWTVLLRYHGWSLWWSDSDRVKELFRRLWQGWPDAFGPDASHWLWRNRKILPADVLREILLSWFASGEPSQQQLASEFSFAAALVEPEDEDMAVFSQVLLAREVEACHLGALFAAAAGWREQEPAIRRRAHEFLAPQVIGATGDAARAIASIVDSGRTLQPDKLTQEMFEAIGQNDAVLRACLNGRFGDALQSLLLHPGFELPVLELVKRGIKLTVGEDNRFGGRLLDEDLVSIAIALQRHEGQIRVSAMDLYEQMLEADAYYATRAAKASLQR